MAAELGTIWAECVLSSEWRRLQAVLLHRPGPELGTPADPKAAQLLGPLALDRAQAQHDALAAALQASGVTVHMVEPPLEPAPNQMFVADLLFMTPEGAILGRPASTVRAGEERWVARRLAALGVPIVRSVSGRGTFEGADAAWLDDGTVLLGRGLRTNAAGAAQVAAVLAEMGVTTLQTELPPGAMHLMGQLRFADRDLALGWPGRVDAAAERALREHGYEIHWLPDEAEIVRGGALNFVTLGPRQILMAAGNAVTQRFYESLGIGCQTIEVDELLRAAGGIGCLTGVLHREPA